MTIEDDLNNHNPPAMVRATRFMQRCEEKYQRENPCPQCGSHNTHLEPTAISGAYSAWVEWCDDCGWKKESGTP